MEADGRRSYHRRQDVKIVRSAAAGFLSPRIRKGVYFMNSVPILALFRINDQRYAKQSRVQRRLMLK